MWLESDIWCQDGVKKVSDCARNGEWWMVNGVRNMSDGVRNVSDDVRKLS